MRLLLARLSVVSVLLGSDLPARSQVDVSNDLETIRTNRHMPGLSALAIKQGRIMAQGAAGYRRQGQSARVLVADPINIASCTKWMTATIAGRLVDRGIIGWDTRVRDLFTNYQTFDASFYDVVNRSWATPGQALNHGGDIWGEDTVVWMAPARDFIVVVFTNCRSADNSTALALDDVAGLLVSRYSGATASGPWLEAPTALPLRLVGNSFAFDYLTLPGVPYVVEISSNLSDSTSWAPANGTNGKTAIGLQSSYTDTTQGIRRFFRVKAVP